MINTHFCNFAVGTCRSPGSLWMTASDSILKRRLWIKKRRDFNCKMITSLIYVFKSKRRSYRIIIHQVAETKHDCSRGWSINNWSPKITPPSLEANLSNLCPSRPLLTSPVAFLFLLCHQGDPIFLLILLSAAAFLQWRRILCFVICVFFSKLLYKEFQQSIRSD